MTDELTSCLTYWPAEDVLPPHLLIDHWVNTYTDDGHMPECVIRHVANQAAQWGADRELELCLTYVDSSHEAGQTAEDILAARRRKPPSLKEQAYDALDTYIYGEPDPKDKERTYNIIRTALEELPQ